jgi:Large polyvalent protein-associated domain 7
LRYRTTGLQIVGPSREIGVASGGELPRRAVLNNLGWFANSAGVNYVRDGRTIFSDEGKRVVFRDLGDDQVRAGLSLAREKWSSGLCLSGNESFREKATRLSDEMRIKVLDGALRRIIPDLQVLSRRYGKPILECRPIAGHQYSGRLVTAGVDGAGAGVVVIDAGRTLAVLITDVKTVSSLPPTGAWVRGRAASAHSFGSDHSTLTWRLRELERPELGRGIGGIET